MKRTVSGATFARVKFVNGIVFMALGVFLFVEIVRSAGFAFRGAATVMVYLMPLALIGLGATRLKGGWPRK